jgi:hypothetical protein
MTDFDPAVIVVKSDGDTVVIDMVQPVTVIDVTDRNPVEVIHIGELGGPPGPQGPAGPPAVMNLLTVNQASVETDLTGLGPTNNATGAVRVAGGLHGGYAMRVSAAAADPSVGAGTPRSASDPYRVLVAAGKTYTATVSFKHITGNRTSGRVQLVWWDADNGVTGSKFGPTVAGTTSWGSSYVTAVAPAGTAYASIEYAGSEVGAAGDQVLLDCFGLWEGTTTQWSIPIVGQPGPAGPAGPPGPTGVPGPAGGVEVTHPNTVDVLVRNWDNVNARWQTVHYDSGWRNVSADMINGWTGTLTMRRLNSLVFFGLSNLTGPGTFVNCYSIPAGFTGTTAGVSFGGIGRDGYWTGGPVWFIGNGNLLFQFGGLVTGTWAAGMAISGSCIVPTDEAIPTTLPGTLVGPAPSRLPVEVDG